MKKVFIINILIVVLFIYALKAEVRVEDPYDGWQKVDGTEVLYDIAKNGNTITVKFINSQPAPVSLKFYLSYMDSRVSDYYTVEISASKNHSTKVMCFENYDGRVDWKSCEKRKGDYPSCDSVGNRVSLGSENIYTCEEIKADNCIISKGTNFFVTKRDYGSFASYTYKIDECENLYTYGKQTVKAIIYPELVPEGKEDYIFLGFGEADVLIPTTPIAKKSADENNRPAGFAEGTESGTSGLTRINPNISVDVAFRTILDVLALKDYEIEMINENTGYIRTAWYTKNYPNGDIYRTRFTINFTSDNRSIRMKSEVEFYDSSTDTWEKGVDDDKTKTVKNDITNQIK
ncbi:MAG: hypothetical protein LBQ34_02300 [Alphaproteobacteria bacterium]|jgi:hypothetical protein|nr:hypothetical protein [Alphaproteobacteria bacterium]